MTELNGPPLSVLAGLDYAIHSKKKKTVSKDYLLFATPIFVFLEVIREDSFLKVREFLTVNNFATVAPSMALQD